MRHHIPTRETIAANRFLRPVAHRILVPALWRFNRRSVPRGFALGLLVGIPFPFAHTVIAAVLALPARANVPIAVGTTLLVNPLTIPPLWWSAYHVGHWALRLDHDVPGHPIATDVRANASWLHWMVSQGGPATLVGLVLIAAALSALAYFATSMIWRFRIARKWRNRRA